MKIRSGFVSNRSSSRFICIAKPGVVQKALEKEDEVTKKVVAGYLNSKNADKITLDGNTYELYQMTISTEEFGCDCDLDDDEYEHADDIWNEFTAMLAKTPYVVIRDEYS